MLRMIGGVGFIEPSVDGFRPARIVERAGRQSGDIAGERFAGKCRDEIKAGARAPRARVDDDTSRLMPPCRYCSDSPVISALTVSVICSVISRRVLSAK